MLLDSEGFGSDGRGVVAYLGVDYDEPRPDTYRGITYCIPRDGMMPEQWPVHGPFATVAEAEYAALRGGATGFARLSSFDNFKMDGGRVR